MGMLSLQGAVSVQAGTPLLWIIDSAPLVLAGAGYLVAITPSLPTQKHSENVKQPSNRYLLGRGLPSLFVGLGILPLLLFVVALWVNHLGAQITQDFNRSATLETTVLEAFHAATEQDTTTVDKSLKSIDDARLYLKTRYGAKPTDIDDPFARFATNLRAPAQKPDWTIALQMENAANHLVQHIETMQRYVLAAGAAVFLVGFILVLALVPFGFGLIRRIFLTEYHLQEEKDLLSTVLRTAGAIIVLLDPQGSLLSFNQAAQTLSGYSEDEVRGKTIWDTLVVEQQKEYVKELLTSGRFPNHHESCWQAKDGSHQIISWSHTVVLHPNGSVRMIVGTGIDVTRKRRIEQELRESEARLSEAQHVARMGSWELDARTGEASLSPEMLRLKGFDPSDVAIPREERRKRYHPDDLSLLDNAIATSLKEGTPYALDVRLLLPNGSHRWLHARGTPIPDAMGKYSRLVGTVQDITERKELEHEREILFQTLSESERQLNEAQEVAKIGSWSFDVATGKIHWSREMFRLLEFDPAKGEPDYHTLVQRYHPEDQSIHETLVDQALLDAKPYQFEIRAILDDGTTRWIRSNGRGIRDETGTVIRLFGTVQDITGYRLLQDELRDKTISLRNTAESLRITAEDLERSNADLKEFTSVASHDLKEPVRKVRNFVKMLREEWIATGATVSPEVEDILKRLERTGKRMQDLIEGLLSLASVSTHDSDRRYRLVDLGEIVEDVVIDLDLRIKETGGAICLSVLPKLYADPVQMRQLFQNLLSNALKYHRPGIAPIVQMECVEDREARQIVLQVSDNGIGFAAEDAAHIFAPFTRLENHKQEGSGVGLAICQRVVENHGGSIRASSVLGQGSVFEIILPEREARSPARTMEKKHWEGHK